MKIKKVSNTSILTGNVVDNLDGNSTINAPSIRAVNEIKGKILWTNTNPQAISENTNITLNSDDYDMYEVLYTYSGTLTNLNMQTTGKIKKGYGTRLQFVYVSNGVQCRDREIIYNSDTSFTIGPNIGTDSITTAMIPRYIIGYKTGMFD